MSLRQMTSVQRGPVAQQKRFAPGGALLGVAALALAIGSAGCTTNQINYFLPGTGKLVLLQLVGTDWQMVEGSGDAGDGTASGEVDALGLFVAAIQGGGPPAPDTVAPEFAGLETVTGGPGVGQVTLSWQPGS